MDTRASDLRRVLLLIVLACLWFWGVIILGLQAFYQLAPDSVKVHAKDKQSRTFLDSESYTLFFYDGATLKPINTSRSKYLLVQQGDAVCYSYNSLFGRKINFQHRPCGQIDSYHPILKIQDLFFEDT